MTTEELHQILDDENKKISLKEYQEVLYKLKWDTVEFAIKEDLKNGTSNKCHWYYGEANAFHIALDLSEHINPNQKAIECLRDVKEHLWKERYPNQYGDVVDMLDINFYIDTKIKELEGEE